MQLPIRWENSISGAYKVYWYFIGFLIDIILPFLVVTTEIEELFAWLLWLLVYMGSVIITIAAHIKYNPKPWKWNNDEGWVKPKKNPPKPYW